MTATYASLRTAADKMKHGPFASAVDHVLDSARINADDTIYLEKNEGDWHKIALASIESVLSYHDNKKVIAWFARHGVRP